MTNTLGEIAKPPLPLAELRRQRKRLRSVNKEAFDNLSSLMPCLRQVPFKTLRSRLRAPKLQCSGSSAAISDVESMGLPA